jgi:subtilisin family serine protease
VARRLLAAGLLALCFGGAAAAATAADPLQGQEWWLTHIGADRATPPGPGVPITVVDSGVDATQPEFAGRPNTTYFNTQTVFGREEYHGTIVASVAAAPENGFGMIGVYPQAVLQSFDASSDPRGITDSSAVSGIQAAAAHCPGVINLSFGSVAQNRLLEYAIITAVHNGCLVVAASGNSGESGSPATYPAAWPHVLTVAATDANDQVASFSTTGQDVDVAAPGVDITGAVPLSRNPSGFEGSLDGTSFSAPVVAAAAAWVWTVRPSLTVSQLADVLRHSARDIGAPGFDTASGWGIIDIPAALDAPTPAPDPAEPNDDIEQVKPGRLFRAGEPPLTTLARPSIRVAASIDAAEDPHDVYRIWVPARKTVRVSVSADGRAAARIWGPRTTALDEDLGSRRRDLRGQRVTAGKTGFAAYVEVLLTGRASSASYTLDVTASRR